MNEAVELKYLLDQTREHLRRLGRHGVSHLPPSGRLVDDAQVLAATQISPEPGSSLVTAGSEPTALSPGAITNASAAAHDLSTIRADLGDCRRCKLHSTRKNIVFGVGNPAAPLVFVGEAPGANEDLTGEPFVGDAGQLLDKMILAMGFGRSDVYIVNILKCRPPGNRNPERDEIEACEPFLIRQLSVLRPRVIVALGKFAAQCLLRREGTPINALRGTFHEYQGVRVMPTYHPAYLLRTPSAKRVVWSDLQLVMAELDRLGIVTPRPRAGA